VQLPRIALLAIAGAATVLAGLALAPAAVAAGGGPIPPEYAVAEVLPPRKCTKKALNAGWQDANLVIATAIALAESGCNPDAVGYNGPTEGCPDGSEDRGSWQINDCYHPGVSDECAFKLKCNAEAAYDIYQDASDTFEPWSTWDSRSFRFYLTEARKAVKKVTGEKIIVGVVWTEGSDLNIREEATTESEIVGTLPNLEVIVVNCQEKGESVYSEVFGYETKLWDQIAPNQYVSNAYVDTDSMERIAPKC